MDERDADRYRRHAEVCRVLTDPKRLMLIDALAAGERSVGELAATLEITLANASQHLGVMRHAGIVTTRREGTSVLYRLGEPEIVDACRIIDRLVVRRINEDQRRSRLEPAFTAELRSSAS
jgi:ArsR family transcriptional regulator, virulence genes transcriptional regulator